MAKTKQKVVIDFSDVGSQFQEGTEYLLKCIECEVKEGNKGPYFAFTFEGTDAQKGILAYNNASMSSASLWKLRDLVESFGMEIPDGPMDLSAKDFVGRYIMADMVKETNSETGKSRIVPDGFWAYEGEAPAESDEEEEEEISLDEMSEADIKTLAKAAGVKGKTHAKRLNGLKALDEDDLNAALDKSGIFADAEEDEAEDSDEDEDEAPDADADEDSDEDEDADEDSDEDEDADEDEEEDSDEDEDELMTEDEVMDLSIPELKKLVKEHGLGLDLGKIEGARKKKKAVIKAMIKRDLLADEE